MSDPDDLDKDTAKSSWLCTVKIFIPNLIDHDEITADPDPATVAMYLIEEENGFGAFCDFPEHYQILNMVPYSKAAWQDTVKTRKARDAVTLHVFIQHMREALGGSIHTLELDKIMEAIYAKMTSTP